MIRTTFLPHFLLLTGLLFGCEREKPLRPSSLETPFIRKIEIDGAKSVEIDHINRNIQVVLPKTYNSDQITLQMELVNGVYVSATDPSLTIGFKGAEPMPLIINSKHSQFSHTYKIYVDLEGPIHATLAEQPYIVEDGTGFADVTFLGGIGTIPERPDEVGRLKATLSDASGDRETIENTGTNFFSFANAFKLYPSDNIKLRLTYGEQSFDFPAKLSLTRWNLRAHIDSTSIYWHHLPKGTNINIKGGCFLPNRKYRVRIENAPDGTSLWLQADYLGPQYLRLNIPPGTADGNYFLSIYEDSSLISKYIYNVSNSSSVKGVQQVWTQFNEAIGAVVADAGDFKPLASSAGKDMYISPFPVFDRTLDAPKVKADELPVLKISCGAASFSIVPKVKDYRLFADGALALYYGAYTLPKDLKVGKYKLQLIYSDGRISAPFCKTMDVN